MRCKTVLSSQLEKDFEFSTENLTGIQRFFCHTDAHTRELPYKSKIKLFSQ